jgi:hypothetical protein
LFLLLIVLVTGCAGSAARHIEVDPGPIEPGLTPSQITWILTQEGGGYERRDVRDSLADQTGQVILTAPETRMVFTAIDNPAIRVMVRINNRNGSVRIDFFEEGNRQLSPQAEQRYRQLYERIVRVFGPDQVSDSSGWFF